MRRAITSVLLLVTVSMAVVNLPNAVGAEDADPPFANGPSHSTDWVPGEVLVRYRESAGQGARRAAQSSTGASVAKSIPAFDTQVLDLPSDTSVPEAIAQLSDEPGIASVEPNYRLHLDVDQSDDAQFPNLWGFNNTGQSHGVSTDGSLVTSLAGTADADADVVEAWGEESGVPGTVVAVLDSGVDVTHPDLNDNLWVNPGEAGALATNGLDDDGNGFVDDVHGWDTADNDNTLLGPPTVSGYDHGTHVAGTIAAEDNAEGVVGVCPGCRIMVIKFMKANATNSMFGSVADELEGLAYAKKMGADIINGSYGGVGFSMVQRNALATLSTKGILGVFSAGNNSSDNDLSILNTTTQVLQSPSYPASYNLPGIVSVVASEHKDRYGHFTGCGTVHPNGPNGCTFTSFGEFSTDLTAPGVDILSTLPGNAYGYFNGTSMASPFAAGVAALVKSDRPGLTPVQIKAAMMRSVNKPASLGLVLSKFLIPGNHSGLLGRWTRSDGRINADAALGAGTTPFPVGDGDINGAKKVVGPMTGSLEWGGDTSDLYKKELVKGKTYRVKLDGAGAAASNGGSLDLVVWKPGTKELWNWAGSGVVGGFGSTNDETVTFTATKNAVYYFHPHSFLNANKVNYTLTVKKL